MKQKLIDGGIILGIGLNILLLTCLYLLEYRVGLLEKQHDRTMCPTHE